jgi:hypothetical protein
VTVTVVGVAGECLAQNQQATAVQLPTFSMFTVPTTVVVPDRGSTYMGGIKRASSGRNEFGVPILGKLPYLGRAFKNTGIGMERSASSVRAHVYIHDFEAMEEALLGQPGSTLRGARGAPGVGISRLEPAPQADPWVGRLAEAQRGSAGRPAMSVAEAQRLYALGSPEQQLDEKALSYFQQGRDAEAAGKTRLAVLYYEMAARRATGELKNRVLAQLASLQTRQQGPALAQTQP